MFPRLLTPILVLCAFSTGLANWIERSPGGGMLSWNGITSSSDGIKLAAVVNPGNIWISSDSGGNWTERSPGGGTKSWYCIASSADGTKISAVDRGGNIWTSMDSGVHWVERSPGNSTKNWKSITSSSDGVVLAAVVDGGNIWTSLDSGANWVERSPGNSTKEWQGIASSNDGTKIAAVVEHGDIWTSTDSGANWIKRVPGGSTQDWRRIASSSDGTNLVAVVESDGNIWTSTNSGVNWTERKPGGNTRNWKSVTSSGDGTKLTAVVQDGSIWISADSGANWTEVISMGFNKAWRSVTSSSDGNKLAAVETGGSIWTFAPPQNAGNNTSAWDNTAEDNSTTADNNTTTGNNTSAWDNNMAEDDSTTADNNTTTGTTTAEDNNTTAEDNNTTTGNNNTTTGNNNATTGNNNTTTRNNNTTTGNTTTGSSPNLPTAMPFLVPQNASLIIFTQVADSAASTGFDNWIATDSRDNTHVAYANGDADLMYATNAGGSWVTIEVQGVDLGEANTIKIVIDSNNEAHIAYISYENDEGKMKHATNTNGTWTLTELNGQPGDDFAIMLDSSDNVHIAVTWDSSLSYITGKTGAWVNNTIDDGSMGGVEDGTMIAIDSDDGVHVWYMTSGDVLKHATTDSSGSWVKTNISTIGGREPKMTTDSAGDVHVVFQDSTSKALIHGTNKGGNWSTTVIDIISENSGLHNSSYFSIAVDSNDRVHVSYHDNTQHSEGLKYATDIRGSWVTTFVADNGASGEKCNSIAVDSHGDVHISYMFVISESPENVELRYAKVTYPLLCNASVAPANGGLGDCTTYLESGSTCQPTCDEGYIVSGPSSCSFGTLKAATCRELTCCENTFVKFGFGVKHTYEEL